MGHPGPGSRRCLALQSKATTKKALCGEQRSRPPDPLRAMLPGPPQSPKLEPRTSPAAELSASYVHFWLSLRMQHGLQTGNREPRLRVQLSPAICITLDSLRTQPPDPPRPLNREPRLDLQPSPPLHRSTKIRLCNKLSQPNNESPQTDSTTQQKMQAIERTNHAALCVLT